MKNSKLNVSVKNFLSSDKGRNILIIVAIIVIGLIFITGMFDNEKSTVEDSLSTSQYKTSLESEIQTMVDSIEGIGQSEVLLTIDCSYEYVYLDDGKTLQKIIEPTIRGVAVVCEGADSAVVCAEITDLLTTLLNIPSNKVCISKLS